MKFSAVISIRFSFQFRFHSRITRFLQLLRLTILLKQKWFLRFFILFFRDTDSWEEYRPGVLFKKSPNLGLSDCFLMY